MYYVAGQKQRHITIRIKIVKKLGRHGCLSRFRDFFKRSFESLRIENHGVCLRYSQKDDLALWGALVVVVHKSDKNADTLTKDRVCEELHRCLLALEAAEGCSRGCHKITVAVI